MGLSGAEYGFIMNMASSLAQRNTIPTQAVNKEILLAHVDLVCEFKFEAEKRIIDFFNKKEEEVIAEIVKRKGNKEKLGNSVS